MTPCCRRFGKVMAHIQKILNRIRRSQQDDYSLPLVDSTEDAVALSAEICQNIRELSGDQKLLFLTDLAEIRRGFEARDVVLSRAMQDQQDKISRIDDNLGACAKYASSSVLGKTGEG